MKHFLGILVITFFVTMFMYVVSVFVNMTPLTINTISFMISITVFFFLAVAYEHFNEVR